VSTGGGSGPQLRDATERRVDYLAGEGLARPQGQRVAFTRDLINTLRRRWYGYTITETWTGNKEWLAAGVRAAARPKRRGQELGLIAEGLQSVRIISSSSGVVKSAYLSSLTS
jgi:hypothetical protein